MLRAAGLRVVIFSNDLPRPTSTSSVTARLRSICAKIDLRGTDEMPMLIWADAMTRGEIRRALTNGCSFSFPPRLAQGLQRATAEQIEAVEILGSGSGLHWEALDTDLSVVPELLAGLLGTKAYMARFAGQTTSPAKAAAARVNGAKGGRPRKTAHS